MESRRELVVKPGRDPTPLFRRLRDCGTIEHQTSADLGAQRNPRRKEHGENRRPGVCHNLRICLFRTLFCTVE